MKLHATIVREESGYTLVELMAASLISLLLGGVVFALYGVATQGAAPWQRGVQLENHLHLMAHRLSSDLAYAEQWTTKEEGTWTFSYRTGERFDYALQDSVLWRNGTRMHEESLKIAALHIDPVFTRANRRARLGLTVQNRDRTASVTTTVMLRQPRPWTPLSAASQPPSSP